MYIFNNFVSSFHIFGYNAIQCILTHTHILHVIMSDAVFNLYLDLYLNMDTSSSGYW